MKKKWVAIIIVQLFCILALPACEENRQESLHPIQSIAAVLPSPTPAAPELPLIGPDDPFPTVDGVDSFDRCLAMMEENEKVDLPLPSAKLFGLEGVDGVLYDAAVAYETHSDGDLMMPTLSVVGSYQNETGETCFVCIYWRYHYGFLAYGLTDPTRPQYYPSFCAEAARITLAQQPDGTWLCTDLLRGFTEGYDGDHAEMMARQVAEPDPALMETVQNFLRSAWGEDGGGNPLFRGEVYQMDGVRPLTTTDPYALLDIYLNHYFRPTTASLSPSPSPAETTEIPDG